MDGLQVAQSVMMQLGGFQFGMKTAAYQQLQRSTEWRWPSQELFRKRPTGQFTGPGPDTMTLPGVIYPEWRGGFGQLDAMRAMGDDGKPLALVGGDGSAMGRWIIERVEETQTVFADEGKPRRVEFSLSLRRFPDEEKAASAAPTDALAAVTPTLPTIGAVGGVVGKVQGLASSVSASAKALSSALNKVAGQVLSVVEPVTSLAREATGAISRAAGAVADIRGAADQVLSALGANPVEAIALGGASSLAASAGHLIVSAESAALLLVNTSGQMRGLPPAASRVMIEATATANRAVALARATAASAAAI